MNSVNISDCVVTVTLMGHKQFYLDRRFRPPAKSRPSITSRRTVPKSPARLSVLRSYLMGKPSPAAIPNLASAALILSSRSSMFWRPSLNRAL